MTAVLRDTPIAARERTVKYTEVNGIKLRYISEGAGPLVVFLHGFPQLGGSWRHQIGPVAAAGYHAVAPDLRGYGGTDAPDDPALYTHFHLAGDVVGLITALGHEDAVLVGHDLGSGLAWTMALTMAHRVRGVVALSVPHKPRGDAPPLANASPDFYQRRFQQLEIPEQDLEANLRSFLPALYMACGGTSSSEGPPSLMVPPDKHFSALFPPSAAPPPWLEDELLTDLLAAFETKGFRGPLNWYRNMDANWYLTAPWAPWHVMVPAAYVVGDRDPVYASFSPSGVIASMQRTVPNLVSTQVLPGCGHWTPEERPNEVTAAILSFLRHLDGDLTGGSQDEPAD